MRRLLLAAVLAVTLRSAGAAAASTEIPPPHPLTPGTGILALGDFGVGGPTERAMGAAMKRFEARRPASVLVTLGDNDYTGSPTAFRRNWRESFGWLPPAGVVPTGTLGNHDLEADRGRYEFGPLGMPRAFYKRTIGEVDLFLLDSTRIGAAQTAWLERRLAASAARWKIVAFHHPPFTCGGHEGNAGVARSWVPLFERYRVALVLSGHDHNYQRFAARQGVRYVVHGGGGAPLYALGRCPAGYPRRVVARTTHGFVYLVAFARALRGFAVNGSRGVIDSFTIYP